MKWIRYSRYTGDDFGLSAEDLLKALSDFFLQSGFQNQYMGFSEWNQQTLEDLKNALQRALEQGEAFDPDQAQRIQQALENMTPEQMDEMLNRLVQKLVDEGYINTEQPQQANESGQIARIVRAEARFAERAQQILQRLEAQKVDRFVGDLDIDLPVRIAHSSLT
jgi:Ca-activated chloride channel family protein